MTDTKIAVNESHWYLCALRPWRWAKKDPPIQVASTAQVTGTVSTIAGATITLSATIATSMAGRKFYLDADAIPHRISAHTAGTAVLTLVTSYTGTNTSGTCTIFQDEITVASDILGWPDIRDLHTYSGLVMIPETEFREKARRNIVGTDAAIPKRYACFISASKIRIAPWTQSARLFECSYVYRTSPLTFDGVAGTDTPILPRERRKAIANRAMLQLFPDKRDQRIKVAADELKDMIDAMERTESGFSKLRSYIRRGQGLAG